MKILIVEDEEAIQQVVAKILRREGHDVVVVRSGTQALHFLESDWLDAVITDIRLGDGLSGIDLLRAIQRMKQGWQPKTILTSGFALEFSEGSRLPRPDYFLLKPFGANEILQVLVALRIDFKAA